MSANHNLQTTGYRLRRYGVVESSQCSVGTCP